MDPYLVDLACLEPGPVLPPQLDQVPQDEGVLGQGGEDQADAAADPVLEGSLLTGDRDALAVCKMAK